MQEIEKVEEPMETLSSISIEHVLIPCDFSPQSAELLRYGCDLAMKYKASVTLLHVYEPPTYAVPPDATMLVSPEVLAKQLTDVMDLLAQMKKQVELSGVQLVHTKVAQGLPAAEIIRETEENSYQLVVMGTHGRTGLKHVFMGSVAEKVVRKASCPVLTIRTQISL